MTLPGWRPWGRLAYNVRARTPSQAERERLATSNPDTAADRDTISVIGASVREMRAWQQECQKTAQIYVDVWPTSLQAPEQSYRPVSRPHSRSSLDHAVRGSVGRRSAWIIIIPRCLPSSECARHALRQPARRADNRRQRAGSPPYQDRWSRPWPASARPVPYRQQPTPGRHG